MYEVFCYAPKCTDFSTNGLCGDLMPTECVFEEEKNSTSQITMTLAYDDLGRWRSVQVGGYIKCKVPVRTPPAITGDAYAATLDSYRVSSAARTNLQMFASSLFAASLYGDADCTIKLANLDEGQGLNKIADDNKLQSSVGTGYCRKKTYVDTVSIPQALNGVESVAGATRLGYQIFTITEVVSDLEWVKVTATHVTYELLNCYTSYVTENSVTGAAACAGIVNNELNTDNRFTIVSDCSDSVDGGLDYDQYNIIKALLDPDEGICAKYGLCLIRDNFAMYAIKNVGTDRGFTVEYGKNMLDMEHTLNIDETYNRIIPFGKTAKGKVKYLSGTKWIDSTDHIGDYSKPRTLLLDCSDTCTIGKEGCTSENFDTRLRSAVADKFADGCDKPKLTMTVDFLSLGDTEEYAQYRDLDKVYLYDKITVIDTYRNYSYNAEVVSIRHDVLTGRLESCTIDSIESTASRRKIASWQVPKHSGSSIESGSIPAGALSEGAITADDVDDSFGAEVDLTDNEVAQKLDGRASYLSVTKEKVEIFGGEVNIHGQGALSLECDNDAGATVNGGTIWHAKNMVVSTEEPSTPKGGMVWIKPDMVGTMTGTWSNGGISERPNVYTSYINVRGDAISQSPSAGTTYTYTVRVPIYNYSNTDHAGVIVYILPDQTTALTDGINCGRKTISGQGSRYYEATVVSDTWLGNRGTITLAVYTEDRTLTRVNSGSAFELTCSATGAGTSTGWKGCSVYYYHNTIDTITANPVIYIQSDTTPSVPSGASYDLDNSVLSGIGSWTTVQPTPPYWSTTCTVSGFSGSVSIDAADWSAPELHSAVLTRTLDLSTTGHCYGRTADSAISRKILTNIGSFSGSAVSSGTGSFEYTLDLPLYWRASSVAITGLYAVLTAGGKTITLPTVSKDARRDSFRYTQTATSSEWLGNASDISVSVYYTTEETGNYLYAWDASAGAESNRYATLSIRVL